MRALVTAIAVLAIAGSASAAPKKKKKKAKRPVAAKVENKAKDNIERPADAMASPAYRYAQLTEPQCKAELKARKIAVTDEPPTRGVRMPVRLAGKLRGVEFRTNLKEAQRKTTIWEITDCRLVLALDDFAAILAGYDIVDVRHYSLYRKPPEDLADGEFGKRHPGGLAIDAARFYFKDGSYLDVDKHFNGAIGAKTCGDGARPRPATDEALKLREILCKAVEQRLFHVVLTPNYNRPHKNHFHLEITEGWKSFLIN